ncbi:unnamed protein product [Cyprideis torosa]|uniref:Uncharacterized protein n=1 Tax=Cyprideis torosa TaxID=163714 RepID=A0A7R8WV52_9CRUS|nr:unnamed protein product [Cyprideis torosa]CAG0909976.1 unnamed protein product [Cyprideis torosa]
MAPVAIETPVAASASSSSPDDAPAASAGTPGNPRPEPEASLSSEDRFRCTSFHTRLFLVHQW